MASLISRSAICALLLTSACEPQSASSPDAQPKEQGYEPQGSLALAQYLEEQQQLAPDDLWKSASDELLWQALSESEAIVSARVDPGGQALLDQMVQRGQVEILANYPEISRQDLQVADFETLKTLRAAQGIDELEPAAFNDPAIEHRSSSSASSLCDSSADFIYPDDLQWIEPGSRVPWNFLNHQIPAAWELSDGHRVTVGLVDTGSSDFQNAFQWNQWRAGWSSDRFIDRQGSYVDSIWRWKKNIDGVHDRCGHGTFMAGVLAGPRSNNGQSAGVAYRSNLIVYRGTKDVFLNAYHEKKGVTQAILALANRQDVKVISLSLGYIFHARNIADAVRYAHRQGKMIVAAAGTSSTVTNGVGVVFPANMNETVAVTGLKDTPWIVACEDCHYGVEVDFSMVVQRHWDAHRRSVTIGYRSGELAYVGGSSAATAMVAGIAALVWSRHPDWSREQVRRRLEESSDLWGQRDPNYGFGRINALRAVQ